MLYTIDPKSTRNEFTFLPGVFLDSVDLLPDPEIIKTTFTLISYDITTESLRGVVVKLQALGTRGREFDPGLLQFFRGDIKPWCHDNFPGQTVDKDIL